MKRIVLSIVLATVAAMGCLAQVAVDSNRYSEVTRKNGSRVTGRIVEYVQDSHLLLVTNAGDTLSIPLSDVEIIHGKKKIQSAFVSTFGETGPQKGYYGSVYVDFTPLMHFAKGGKIGISTVHGYQLTPYLMLGAGAEVRWGKNAYEQSKSTVIGFADARLFFTRSNITPYFDLRGGYGISGGTKGYISPTLGCRFGLKQGQPLAIHFQMGVTWGQAKPYSLYESGVGLTLRAGFEF